MADGKLHNKHRERVRERYLKEGIDSFEPHQVLELILFYSIPRKDTNELAHKLLDKFGSLNDVLEAPPQKLTSVDGIGKRTAVFLNLFSQVKRKCELEELDEFEYVVTSSDAGEYCVKLFSGRLYECTFLVALAANNKVINYEQLSEGTVKEVDIHPRKVVAFALSNNASKVIIAHNHPGGTLGPSNDDVETTQLINNALKILNVELIDHIIVADGKYTSFKDLELI